MSGRTFATHVSAAGSALIGNSEPAKNHGTIAIAGRAPTYSSCRRMRLASVSATPYMPTESSAAAARNQATPLAARVEVDPAQHCRGDQRGELEPGHRERDRRGCRARAAAGESGAASSSRWAPLSRSTITPMPENIAFSGISRPIVAMATNAA